ncbi:MAG: hypothetical protein NZM07_04225 [Elioraea sp.]|nr:hypothetical protein [Elioraea sp.]
MAARTLVVDEEPNIRELLRPRLKRAGYEVSVAEDAIATGYEGLRAGAGPDRLRRRHAAHGRSQVRRGASRGRVPPRIPVIFLTSVQEGEARSKELGAAAYVTKPVLADRLLALIAEQLGDPARSRG